MHDDDLHEEGVRKQFREIIDTKIEALQCDALAEAAYDRKYHKVTSIANMISRERETILQYKHHVEILTLLQSYKQLFLGQKHEEGVEEKQSALQKRASELEKRLKGHVAASVLKEATGVTLAMPYQSITPQGAQTIDVLLKTVQKAAPFAVLKSKSGVIETREERWWQILTQKKCQIAAYHLPPMITILYWNSIELGQRIFDAILEEEVYKNSVVILASGKNTKNIEPILKAIKEGNTIPVI